MSRTLYRRPFVSKPAEGAWLAVADGLVGMQCGSRLKRSVRILALYVHGAWPPCEASLVASCLREVTWFFWSCMPTGKAVVGSKRYGPA
jgi:hypothetical protein